MKRGAQQRPPHQAKIGPESRARHVVQVQFQLLRRKKLMVAPLQVFRGNLPQQKLFRGESQRRRPGKPRAYAMVKRMVVVELRSGADQGCGSSSSL